jgi:hypothetical protein
MFKTVFVTNLNPEDSKRFSSLYLDSSPLKRKVFLEALKEFKQKNSKKKSYQLKHADIIRINSEVYRIYLFDDISEEIKDMAAKFKVKRNALIREIICEYLSNKI